MDSPSLHDFFGAAAGVAGALIGLLFVAVSVAHERLTAEAAEQSHRVRASAALTAFINALTVSLFALIPGINAGWTASIVAFLGLLFVAGALVSVFRVRQSQPKAPRDVLFLVGLLVVFGFQLRWGIGLISHPGDQDALESIAVIVIVCFLIGIGRSWELVGGPSIGLTSELTAIWRARSKGDSNATSPDE